MWKKERAYMQIKKELKRLGVSRKSTVFESGQTGVVTKARKDAGCTVLTITPKFTYAVGITVKKERYDN